MWAVALVYTDSTVCLGALIKYIVVLLSLSFPAAHLSQCVLRVCVFSQKCLCKRGCCFSGASEWTREPPSGLGKALRKLLRCARERVCVCVWPVAAMCHDIFHSNTSVQRILRGAYFDISSSIWEQEMLSDLLSGRDALRADEVFSPDRTRWMDVSVIVWITVCFVSGLWPSNKECEARSNLAKSVFHLSLEQTGAGELTPIYHRCEIPAPLIWS